MDICFYKIVHFIPDPFTGGRLPIGAMVYDRGKISIVPSPAPLCPTCVSPAMRKLIELALLDMESATTMDIPSSCGPQIVADKGRVISPLIPDPIAWVKRLLFGDRDDLGTAGKTSLQTG
jgi:hypothetical protein